MTRALVLALDVWDPARGGLESYAESLATGLAERGFEPRLVCGEVRVAPEIPHEVLGVLGPGFYEQLDRQADEQGRATSDGAPVLAFRHPGRRCRVFLPLGGLLAASLDARRSAEPLALALPRRWARALSSRTRAYLARERAFFADPDEDRLVLAASKLVADDVAVRFPGFGGQVRITGLPIREDRFLPAGPDLRRRLRQEKLGDGVARPVLLWIGNDPIRKGLSMAKRVLERLRLRRLDARLVLAGHGTESFDDPAKGVHGLGHVDPAMLYSMADVLIAPSLEDGFHLGLVEALAAGLPVVCSGRVGASMLLGEAELGRVVQDPTDLDGFDRAVLALCVKGALDFDTMEARRRCVETSFYDRHLDHVTHLLVDHLPSLQAMGDV